MAEILKKKGNESFKNCEYKKAAKLYRDAIVLDPSNPVLYSNRSMCFLKLKDWQRVLLDSNKGIQLCGNKPENNKTLVKLLYRKGLALLQIRNTADGDGNINEKVARKAFEDGLRIDPGNSLIRKELATLDEEKDRGSKDISEKALGLQTIEIEEVETLPKEYQALINGLSKSDVQLNEATSKLVSSSPSVSASSPGSSLLSDLPKSLSSLSISKPKPLIQEIDTKPDTNKVRHSTGQKKESSESSPSSNNSNIILTFPQIPTHYYLTSLTKYQGPQRYQAYNYVIGVSPLTYLKVFEFGGVDSEFLEFFLDAAIYIFETENNRAKDDGETTKEKVLALLKTFAVLKRFELSKMLCSDGKIAKVIKLLKMSGINDENAYGKWM